MWHRFPTGAVHAIAVPIQMATVASNALSTMNEPPYHLDIDGIEDPFPVGWALPTFSHSARPPLPDRPWVGIHFDCCSVYTRIYRNTEGTAYHARCPRCLREVTLRVGPGGTDARFFLAE